MKSLKTNKKTCVRNYQYRLVAIKRRLNVGLREPEDCLNLLEKIVEKRRPVVRNLIWYTVDKYFYFLIQNMSFNDKKRYDRLMKKYDRIDKEAETLNYPVFLKSRKSRDFQEIGDRVYVKTARVDKYSLKLALKGKYRNEI